VSEVQAASPPTIADVEALDPQTRASETRATLRAARSASPKRSLSAPSTSQRAPSSRSATSRSGCAAARCSRQLSESSDSAYVHSMECSTKAERSRWHAAKSVPWRCGTAKRTARSLPARLPAS
jgi:hypothetical protein